MLILAKIFSQDDIMLHIISYNVNGIRAALSKGLETWLDSTKPDIIGFQELKALPEQVDAQIFAKLGYTWQYWHSAEKKGYSGVGIFSKIEADYIELGMGHPGFDAEGRVLRADFGELTLLNCYLPSGTSGDIRQTAKYEFLDYFYDWVLKLKQSRPKLLIQGDFNIAHTEMDIHNPKSNLKTSGFLPEERAWLTRWRDEAGFVDSFRQLHPQVQKYSWWTMRSASARSENKGWRIDYQWISPELLPQLQAAELHNEAVHSDHCPCAIQLNLPL